MSGGSFDYGCYTLERLYSMKMDDDELNNMMIDLIKVLHDLEWWDSGDIGEEAYRKTVSDFKSTWFGTRDDAIRQRLCDSLDKMKTEILDR